MKRIPDDIIQKVAELEAAGVNTIQREIVCLRKMIREVEGGLPITPEWQARFDQIHTKAKSTIANVASETRAEKTQGIARNITIKTEQQSKWLSLSTQEKAERLATIIRKKLDCINFDVEGLKRYGQDEGTKRKIDDILAGTKITALEKEANELETLADDQLATEADILEHLQNVVSLISENSDNSGSLSARGLYVDYLPTICSAQKELVYAQLEKQAKSASAFVKGAAPNGSSVAYAAANTETIPTQERHAHPAIALLSDAARNATLATAKLKMAAAIHALGHADLQACFHAHMNDGEAERKLSKNGTPAAYLLHPSSSKPGCLTLSVLGFDGTTVSHHLFELPRLEMALDGENKMGLSEFVKQNRAAFRYSLPFVSKPDQS